MLQNRLKTKNRAEKDQEGRQLSSAEFDELKTYLLNKKKKVIDLALDCRVSHDLIPQFSKQDLLMDMIYEQALRVTKKQTEECKKINRILTDLEKALNEQLNGQKLETEIKRILEGDQDQPRVSEKKESSLLSLIRQNYKMAVLVVALVSAIPFAVKKDVFSPRHYATSETEQETDTPELVKELTDCMGGIFDGNSEEWVLSVENSDIIDKNEVTFKLTQFDKKLMLTSIVPAKLYFPEEVAEKCKEDKKLTKEEESLLGKCEDRQVVIFDFKSDGLQIGNSEETIEKGQDRVIFMGDELFDNSQEMLSIGKKLKGIYAKVLKLGINACNDGLFNG